MVKAVNVTRIQQSSHSSYHVGGIRTSLLATSGVLWKCCQRFCVHRGPGATQQVTVLLGQALNEVLLPGFQR